jgi:hypothetical protein
MTANPIEISLGQGMIWARRVRAATMKGKHEYSSRANLVANEGRNEDRDTTEDQQDNKLQKKATIDVSPGGRLPSISG